ncbi:MAG: hypothetical protein C0404_07840 [Verrucomicrobia bacterium]|nr:hypothetical protein [Verrucomicrobiota bacterium]
MRALDVLAAAQADAGQFADAVKTLGVALRLQESRDSGGPASDANGDRARSRELMLKRFESYKTGIPWREGAVQF